MSGSSYGSTAVPAPTFDATGFVAPAESDILAGRLSDLNAALGGNANTGLTTPQGQMASSFTAALGDAYDQILAVLNGVDPARAFGRLQDAIGYIYFMNRNPATATVVSVNISGTAGTTISQGYALIKDASGNIYTADSSITINDAGVGSGTFSCVTGGAISVAANSVVINQSLSGVTSVNNPAAGVTGSGEETPKAFEMRRAATVEANAVGVNNAIRAALLNAPGVTDAYVIDNPSATAVTTGGVSIAPNSLYICVVGGTDTAVGQAIISKKNPGCSYTGTSTVTVSDPNSTYSSPPTYSVTFTRAALVPLYIQVTLANSTAIPSAALTMIQAAIQSTFSGFVGQQIGRTVFASSFYAAVAALGEWAEIIEITIGTAASPTGFTAPMNINQVPTLSNSNITLVMV